jgi:hypothetical protein
MAREKYNTYFCKYQEISYYNEKTKKIRWYYDVVVVHEVYCFDSLKRVKSK